MKTLKELIDERIKELEINEFIKSGGYAKFLKEQKRKDDIDKMFKITTKNISDDVDLNSLKPSTFIQSYELTKFLNN